MFKKFMAGTAFAALMSASSAMAAPLLVVDQVWVDLAETTAEINAYDPATNQVFVAAGNQVDVIDFATGSKVTSIDFGDGEVNSVDVSNGKVAIAVAAASDTAPGTVEIFSTNSLGAAESSVTVGVLPDMLTYTPDGSKIVVANEAEPEGYAPGQSDPVGSISIIDVATLDVQTAGFEDYIGQEEALRDKGVRIFGPGSNAAQDLEPEYVAINPEGTKAYVALQENNALAVVDLATATVTDILPLGLKDYGLPGNSIDPSDEDGVIEFAPQPNVFGMYQPDGITTITIGGETYIASANEGDAREYDLFVEGDEEFTDEDRTRDVDLAPGFFPGDAQEDENLGRLEITIVPGITDDGINDDGQYEKLLSFGARSFSLWNEDGTLAFDSGDFVDKALGDLYPDGRSDAKGSEPEAVEVGVIGDRTYLFLGLERASAIMIFDLTDFDLETLLPEMLVGTIYDEDLSRPEGIRFIGAEESPDGASYLLASYESGDEATTLFRLTQVSEPATLALFGAGIAGIGLRMRRRAPR